MFKIIGFSIAALGFVFIGIARTPEASAAAKPAYVFEDHLKDAEAFLLKKPVSDYENNKPQFLKEIAEWQNESFVFPDLSDERPIMMTTLTFDGKEETAISFSPSQEGVKVLKFKRVKTGSRMRLAYGVEDIALNFEGNANVYLNIWVGHKKLRRMIIPVEKGWKEAEIDLGVLSLLKFPINVTFEISSDHEKARFFNFRAFFDK